MPLVFHDFKLFSHRVCLLGQKKFPVNQDVKYKSINRCGALVEGKDIGNVSFRAIEVEVFMGLEEDISSSNWVHVV